MKTKKNKKRYNFTEKQLRKDRSLNYKNFKGAPNWYVRTFNVKFKNECNMILKNNIINGTDKSYPLARRTAGWYWW